MTLRNESDICWKLIQNSIKKHFRLFMSMTITQNPIKCELGLGEMSISMLTVKESKSNFRLKSEHQLSFGSKR